MFDRALNRSHVLDLTGTDITIFTAHSTRAASTSKALGIPAKETLKRV